MTKSQNMTDIKNIINTRKLILNEKREEWTERAKICRELSIRDPELAHYEFDELLLEMISEMGFSEIALEFGNTRRFYK